MEKFYCKLSLLLLSTALTISCTKDEPLEKENAKLSAASIKTEMAITGANSSRADFILGMSGHPLSTTPYITTPATTQIKLLKDMGMTYYRFDVQTMPDGRINTPELFSALLKASQAGGVKLLPMIVTRTLEFSDSQSTAYRKGRETGSRFAARYKQYFSVYNLGNELETKFILPNKTGRSRLSYNRDKFVVAAAYLKGMDEGIKAEHPGAKTLIDFAWLHIAYIQMLQEYGVKFDILGCHWYSEMEGAAATKFINVPDVTALLAEKFPNKPIWFNEVNKRPKNLLNRMDWQYQLDQDAFLRKFIEKCKRNPQVEALFVYELFDNPEKGGYEGKYGIIGWDSHYSTSMHKVAFTQLAERN